MATSIKNFLKITKEKVIITLIFPLAAFLIYWLGAIAYEIHGFIIDIIYNVLIFFILLPFALADLLIREPVDSIASQVLVVIALVLTLIWWYILPCILVFLLEKRRKR